MTRVRAQQRSSTTSAFTFPVHQERAPDTLASMVDDSVAAGLASAASLVAASAQPGTLAVGGRGVKRRADGVVYTRENKLIAVYYMFGSSTSRALNVGDRAKRLKVNRPTLYEWRKEFPEAWQPGKLPPPGSELAEQLTRIRGRTDDQNIATFLTPNDHVAGILSTSSGGSAGTAGGSSFVRPDRLGPEAEPEESFSPHVPGDLPPEVVEILRRVDGQSDITFAEQEQVAAMRVDGDVGKEATLLVETTITQAATLQRDTLRPSTNKLWDRPKQNFIMFWKGLDRLRSTRTSTSTSIDTSSSADAITVLNSSSTASVTPTPPVPPEVLASSSSLSAAAAPSYSSPPSAATAPASSSSPSAATAAAPVIETSGTAFRNAVIVTEQKLVTYLNCFVLHRNPRLGYESIKTEVKAITNLWETQRILGINNHPSPRAGGLIKAYLKAVSKSRAALAEAVCEDWWKHSLKDGYDENEYLAIARWFLRTASYSSTSTTTIAAPANRRTNAARERRAVVALRGRFEFLMQHALMSRSEDLRNAKLAATYTIAPADNE
ncbi:hypothetical protein A4X13_0g4522 [Tilletia indica]|uniref:Uncharacterized protein n=1 Tax=Tilletia indica TaxID=43049 RepID=A0A8T8SXW2_9BASI|nr:hypothetical protein A4X13_0g4522 [Tilletia indica]